MGIKQLCNDNLRKLPNEYGDVSVMCCKLRFTIPLTRRRQNEISDHKTDDILPKTKILNTVFPLVTSESTEK